MACYFNQDFNYMFSSVDEALAEYAATSHSYEIAAIVGELDTWLASGTDGLLSRFTAEVSKWDMTIGFSDQEAREWLQHARHRLAEVSGCPRPA